MSCNDLGVVVSDDHNDLFLLYILIHRSNLVQNMIMFVTRIVIIMMIISIPMCRILTEVN